MCGIAGIFLEEQADAERLRAAVCRMGAAQIFRGPDGHGAWADERIGLGCVRLQVTGGESAGRQPIADRWGGVLVFNGEIYEHARILEELGEPPAEADGFALSAVLARKGVGGLRAVRGMFAAARYDPARRSLLLVRDAVGKKPLYVRRFSGGWAFASTIAALHAGTGPLQVRPDAIYEYLVFRSVGGLHSAFEGVEQVAPGSWVELCAGGSIRSGRWWRPPEECSRQSPAEEVRAELDRAVAVRLARDRPVAVFLSGGLDSSIVAGRAVARRPARPARLLTVGYDVPGEEDEAPMACRVASHLGCAIDRIRVRAADVPELMEKATVLMEDPIQDPVVVPTLALARAAARQTKVVLTGDGSDEIWGGYARFDMVERRPQSNSCRSVLDAYLPHTAIFQPGELGLPDLPRSYLEDVALPARRMAPLDFILRVEVANRLRNYHLARLDKLTMGVGLEARCPFLDTRVVNLGLTIPCSWKRPGGKPKGLLAAAFGDLPPWLLARRKQPFTVPIQAWLKEPLNEFARDTLSSPSAFARSFADPAACFRAVAQGGTDGGAAAGRLWSLLQLEVWYRHFATKVGASLCQSITA